MESQNTLLVPVPVPLSSESESPVVTEQSKENGSEEAPFRLDSPPSGEDDFETASDPDVEDPDPTMHPTDKAVEIEEKDGIVVGVSEDNKAGSVGTEEQDEVLSGEKEEVAVPVVEVVAGDAVGIDEGEEDLKPVEEELEAVEVENKDEILGGEEVLNYVNEGDVKPVEVEGKLEPVAREEVTSGVVEAVEDSKPVEVEVEDAGIEEKVEPAAQEEETSNIVEVVEDSKPVEVESENVKIEEDLEPAAQEVVMSPVLESPDGLKAEENVVPDVKDDNLGTVESEAVRDNIVEEPVELKLAVDENVAVAFAPDVKDENLGDDESEVADASPAIEGEAELKPEKAELENDGADVNAVSERSLQAAADLKPMEVESSAVDLNVVEVEPAGVEAVDDGATKSLAVNENLGGEEESKAIEAEPNVVQSENIGAVETTASEENIEMVNNPDSETLESNSSESPAVAEVLADDVGSEIAKGSTYKLVVDDGDVDENSLLKQETGDEDLAINTEEASADFKAKPSDVDNSNSKDTGELLEASVMAENGNAREISIEDLLHTFVSLQKEGPDVDENPDQEEDEFDDTVSGHPPRVAILDSSETAKQIIKEMEEGSSGTSSISGFESSRDYQHQIDGQVVTDSDEEVDTDEEGDGKDLIDSAALAALLKAATGSSDDGSITITSSDGSRVFSIDRPAGLGSSAPSLRPAAPARSSRPTLFNPTELAVFGEDETEMNEEEKKLHEKVEEIRVKFLRLVMKLGHSPDDTVAAQVLYRLSLAEGIRRGGRQMGRAISIESAKKKALQLEADGKDDLGFSCNILVLGKSGVGKSATINSIFSEERSHTDAFKPATTAVREISGLVDGVKIRVIDTPGLKASVMDQAHNKKILASIKKYTKKCPPDIVLYVDRLDTHTRDFNDLPLLRSITNALGSSIWFNAIVALTHASSAPPEGPNGSPLSYEVFIAQRSHVVQHSIRQAAGDMRLMNPVALVENHPSCRRNREGQRVLPNGLTWRPQMLLLCYSSKILSEANSLLKLQDPSPGKLFGYRFRSPPLPYLLSSLLQARPHPKLSADLGGDNGDSDVDLDDFSDGEQEEEEDEYDQLPPFKPLKKSQIAKLTKEQKRAYFDEYDYRVKLLQKKQWKEELRRLKEMKKRGKSGQDASAYPDPADDFDQAPAAVPVPLPDMVLPPSFDCDVPTYRYRFLEPTSQLLTRPVLDTHGWDHDCGYDGVSLEETLAIASRFPATVAVQITKDKKEFNIHLDSSVSAKHGESGSTLAGFDIQSIGKQLAYILRGETKFKNFKKNKTTAGMSVTFLGETVATGLKVEDQIIVGKRVVLSASTGAIRAQGDVAYGANLEARLRDKDFPIGQALTTLGLSLMKWRNDLALGANLQSQLDIGRNSKVAVRVGLNNKLSGQITVKTSTSEHLQLALVGIIPVALSIFRSIWPGESYLVH